MCCNCNDHAPGRITAAPTSTRTFAGYQATVPAGSATVLVASFTVPALPCTSANRAIAPSTGVPVHDCKSVSAAFVFTGCVNGTAVYFPGLVVNGTETDYPASPLAASDVIDLTTKVSTNRTRAQVTDATVLLAPPITVGLMVDARHHKRTARQLRLGPTPQRKPMTAVACSSPIFLERRQHAAQPAQADGFPPRFGPATCGSGVSSHPAPQ
jgi:hypothetical protein